MHHSPLLGPVVALVAWSILMFFWLAIARAPQLRGRRIADGVRGRRPGARGSGPAQLAGAQLPAPDGAADDLLCDRLRADPHGVRRPINVYLAWGYVGFRILHSIFQATVNVVPVRFLIFLLATLCLIGLTTHAAIFLIHRG